MKIKGRLKKRLREAIIKSIETNMEHTKQEYLDHGFSEMRYRWDVFWCAVNNGYFNYNDLEGCNDNHIDTALKKLVP